MFQDYSYFPYFKNINIINFLLSLESRNKYFINFGFTVLKNKNTI